MKSKYALTETQVEALAAEHAGATGAARIVGTTYLRVIVAGCQQLLGTKRKPGRPNKGDQMTALGDVSGRYYAAVLRGITTPDIAHDATLPRAEQKRRAMERNVRSTFARATKSTLASYIASGGDLRTLDADTVTRDPLLTHVRASKGINETGHRIERHAGAVLRLAKRDPKGAQDALRAAIAQLQAALTGPGSRATVTRLRRHNGKHDGAAPVALAA